MINSSYTVNPEYATPANDTQDPYERFIDAFDRWSLSKYGCGGVLFDALLEARESLMEKYPLADSDDTA